MSAKKRVTVSFKTDKETAKEAKAIFGALGMNLSTGMNVYLKQVVASEGLPFTPSAKVAEALPLDVADDTVPDSQVADSKTSNETEP